MKLTANTHAIEENFSRWILGDYWQDHPRSLSSTTRDTLISSEYVWQHYQDSQVQDWATPAIQYCRALEHKVKRRLYTPAAFQYPPNNAGFTLGTLEFAYQRHSRP